MKKLFIILFILFISVNVYAGTTYYVAPTGNDTTGDGTIGNRWATPQRCITAVSAGDTCMIGDGTYTDTDYSRSIVFINGKNGNSGAWITIKAEHQYLAILDGTLTHYTHVTGWTQCTNPTCGTGSATDVYWSAVTGQVNHVAHGAIGVVGLDSTPVRKTSIGDLTTTHDWYYDSVAHKLYYKYSGVNTRYFVATDGAEYGILVDNSSYIQIEGFEFINAYEAAYMGSSSSYINIYKNKIENIMQVTVPCDSPAAGLGIGSALGGSPSSHVTIARNVFNNTGRLKNSTYCFHDYNKDHTIYVTTNYLDILNNIIYDNEGTSYTISDTYQNHVNIVGNVFYTKVTPVSSAGDEYKNVKHVQITPGSGQVANYLVADNIFYMANNNSSFEGPIVLYTWNTTPAQSAASVKIYNNIVYGDNPTTILSYYPALPYATTPVPTEAGTQLNIDPKLTSFDTASFSNCDFHLLSNSPGINTGYDPSAYVAFTEDMDGDARPIASLYDIGADETNYAAGDVTAPSIPGSVTAVAQSSSAINVDWADSTDNVQVVGYEVWRCVGVSCSDYGSFPLVTTGVSNYSDTNMTPNTSYSYKIKAYDAVPNKSAFSSIVTAVTSPTVPSGTNIMQNPGFEVANLSPWVAYSNGSATFSQETVLMHNGSGAAKYAIATEGTNVQIYQQDLTLDPNTAYTLTFWAYSNTGHDMRVVLLKGTSPYTNYGVSSVVDLTTGWALYTINFSTIGFASQVIDGRLAFHFHDYDVAGDIYYIDDVSLIKQVVEVINPPTGLSVSDVTPDNGGALHLNWTVSNTSGVTNQYIYRSTGAGYTLIQTLTNNTTATYTDIGLANGTTYYYVIKAEKSGVFSADSSSANAIPTSQATPSTPVARSLVTRPVITRTLSTRGTVTRP